MRLYGTTRLGHGLLLLVFCGTALADDEWQTVNLDNNPNFTIDIPAKVGNGYKPDEAGAAQGVLLHFAVATDGAAGLICVLSRFPKDKKAEEKKFRAMLASPRRDALCSDDTATNLKIGASDSLTIDGQPAGECAASYTVSNSSLPGRVMNPLEIAAAKSHYLLTCYYATTSQDEATAAWVAQWSGKVKHIQQSIRLPADEKK